MLKAPAPENIRELVQGMFVRHARIYRIPHVCNAQCTFRHLTTVVVTWHRGYHVCCPEICTGEGMICPFSTRPPALTPRHVTAAVGCGGGSHNGCTFTLIPHVYVCTTTGQVHLCGPACAMRTIDDGTMQPEEIVCPLTQQQFGQVGQSEQHCIVAALRNKTEARFNRFNSSTMAFRTCMQAVLAQVPHVVARCSDRHVFIGIPATTRVIPDDGAAQAVAAMLKGGGGCVHSAAYAVAVAVLSNRLRAASKHAQIRSTFSTCAGHILSMLMHADIPAEERAALPPPALTTPDLMAVNTIAGRSVPHPPCAVTDERFHAACEAIASYVTYLHRFMTRNDVWTAAARRAGISRLSRNVLDYTSLAAGIVVLLADDLEVDRVVVSKHVQLLRRILPDDHLQSCGIRCTGVTEVVSDIKKIIVTMQGDAVPWPVSMVDSDSTTLNDRLRAILSPE